MSAECIVSASCSILMRRVHFAAAAKLEEERAIAEAAKPQTLTPPHSFRVDPKKKVELTALMWVAKGRDVAAAVGTGDAAEDSRQTDQFRCY